MALVISQPRIGPPAAASSFKRLKASRYLGEYCTTRCSESVEDEEGARREAKICAALDGGQRRILPEMEVCGWSRTV